MSYQIYTDASLLSEAGLASPTAAQSARATRACRAATLAVANYLGYRVDSVNEARTFALPPVGVLTLPLDPFQSISAMTVQGTSVDLSDYVLARSGRFNQSILDDTFTVPYDSLIKTGGLWPIHVPLTSPAEVVVTAVWGFSVTPEDIVAAAAMTANQLFSSADSPLGTAGSVDIGVVNVHTLSPIVKSLLAPYRSSSAVGM